MISSLRFSISFFCMTISEQAINMVCHLENDSLINGQIVPSMNKRHYGVTYILQVMRVTHTLKSLTWD